MKNRIARLNVLPAGGAGVKFADMDLIGLPWQLVIGARTVDAETVELKNRRTGAREEMSLEAAVRRVVE